MNVWTAVTALALVAPVSVACSSSGNDPVTGAEAGSAAQAGGIGMGGSSPSGGAGVSTQGGGVATGGVATGGVATGGVTTGGVAGVATGGSAGTGGASAGSGGTPAGGTSSADPCGMPATHKLNVAAALGEHVHGTAGLDTRAKTMLGKLVLDYGVSGGNYLSFLAKRGYHSIAAPKFTECAAPDLVGDRTRVGKCRLGEITTTQAAIEAQLAKLQAQYPEEDWGYFLDATGKLRWSDVATTGYSHGATTAAVTGHVAACVWRVVARSGPRDDTCGKGNGQCTAPLTTPSYDPACTDANVADWIDQPSKTPIDRFYGLVGMQDSECGDIMFDMHRAKFLGEPVIFDAAGADLSTSHQFFAATLGHVGFIGSGVTNGDAVIDIAFGIPTENRNPSF